VDVEEVVADAVGVRRLTAEVLMRTDADVEEDDADAVGVETKMF